MSGVGTLYDKVVLFPGWSQTSGTFYLDNIKQGTASGIGVGEKIFSTPTLAPNPANDIVNIKLSGDNGRFTIVTLMGQVVASGNLTEGPNLVPIAQFADGIYMVHVSNQDGDSLQKLVIRH